MTNEDAQEGHDESQKVKWVSYIEMSEGLRGKRGYQKKAQESKSLKQTLMGSLVLILRRDPERCRPSQPGWQQRDLKGNKLLMRQDDLGLFITQKGYMTNEL